MVQTANTVLFAGNNFSYAKERHSKLTKVARTYFFNIAESANYKSYLKIPATNADPLTPAQPLTINY